jgi:hypothetical protein
MTGQASEESWLTPSPVLPLRGDEQFTGVDATVIDFWRWAFSDLRDNTTRGILAEFLVSKAVGDAREMRIGWGNFDALTPDGSKIEVKCSAFLQSWTLKRLSELRFGRLRAREFDADRNELSADVRVRADVFVFAVQAQQDPASYDMLDIGHWEFWVASAGAVRESMVTTVGIGWVRQHARGPLAYSELADAIRAAVAGPLPGQPSPAAVSTTTASRAKVSLDKRLQQAGPDVLASAQRLRELAAETGLTVVAAAASLKLHDTHGAVVRLYPGYQSIEFVLAPLIGVGHDSQTAEIRRRLSHISSGPITRKEPSISCRDALAAWDVVTEVIHIIVAHRARNSR